MRNKNNKTNIINFLLSEFNIIDSSKKAIQAIKVKKISNKNNNFKNISSLLDEALVCLPKKDQIILKDADEAAASRWFNLHKEARDAVYKYFKNDIGKNELKRFEKFLNIASASNFLNTKRIAFTAAIAASLIFSITLVYYQPERTKKYVSFIDNNFFAFLPKQESGLGNEKINNFAPQKYSNLSIAAAKAVYIVKNESDFNDGDIIKISENELFGKIVDKFVINENFDKNKKTINKENKIFTCFKRIINIAESKQERLSLRMQEKLLNLISD